MYPNKIENIIKSGNLPVVKSSQYVPYFEKNIETQTRYICEPDKMFKTLAIDFVLYTKFYELNELGCKLKREGDYEGSIIAFNCTLKFVNEQKYGLQFTDHYYSQLVSYLLNDIGHCHQMLNRLNDSLNFFGESLKFLGNNDLSLLGIAISKMHQNKLKESLHYFLKAKKSNPNNEQISSNLAGLYILLYKESKDEGNLEKSLNESNGKNDVMGINSYIQAYQLSKKYTEEEKNIKTLEFYETMSKNSNYLRTLGDSYFLLKDYENSIKYYKEALKIGGEPWLSNLKLSDVYMEKKDFEAALVLLSNNDPWSFFNKSSIFLYQSKFQESTDCLLNALELLSNSEKDETTNFIYFYQLLYINFWALDCYEEAIIILKEILHFTCKCPQFKEYNSKFSVILAYLLVENGEFLNSLEFLKGLKEEELNSIKKYVESKDKDILKKKIKVIYCNKKFESDQIGFYKNSDPFVFMNTIKEYHINKNAKKYSKILKKTGDIWYMGNKVVEGSKYYNYIIKKINGEIEIRVADLGYGHYHLSEGEPVIYAGEISFKSGKISSWNNCSGHFKPIPGEIKIEDICKQTGFPVECFYSLGMIRSRLENFGELMDKKVLTKELPEISKGNISAIKRLLASILGSAI